MKCDDCQKSYENFTLSKKILDSKYPVCYNSIIKKGQAKVKRRKEMGFAMVVVLIAVQLALILRIEKDVKGKRANV